jgi:hypothetical protein
MEQVTVRLPRGIPASAGDKWIRQVYLRRLVGSDERLIGDVSYLPLHARIVALLERVVLFEEGETGTTLLRHLSIGDRVALMLHVRKMEIGDTIDGMISCARCGKSISVVLSAARLLATGDPIPCASYDVAAGGFKVRIKPLTSLEQDEIVNRAEDEDLDEMLARTCIASSDLPLPEKLPDQLMLAIGLKLEEVDPLSDIVLDVTCSECCQTFSASFNAEDFILKELGPGQGYLESEVHWLALNYHWSESEILSLPVTRRRRYISLINSLVEGGNA